MTSRILSGSIVIVVMRGAYFDSSGRGALSALFITSRIFRRATLACAKVCFIIAVSRPIVFVSSWIAVIPSEVPVILKSIPPSPSSKSCKSVNTSQRLMSGIEASPIAIPATAFFNGTPASNKASDAAQVEAIEDEPFEDIVSDTTRIVYGNSSLLVGTTGSKAFSAKAPWPISRRPGPRLGFASPTE